MKNFRKLCVFILFLFVITNIFVSCNNGNDNSDTLKVQETEIVSGLYPLEVVDSNGVNMTIEKKPESIVSLTLGSDEMLLELVESDRIKALCGAISEDDGISNISDKAKDFDKAENNIEKIISLKPDIVFVANWMDEKQVKQMRDAKIPVYCNNTALTIEDQKDIIMNIAKIVGEEEKGKEIVKKMDDKLKEIEDAIGELKDDEKLTVMNYDSMGNTNGKRTLFDDIVTKAGLINASSKAGLEAYAVISKEKIIEINPDVIILPSWSYDGKLDTNKYLEDFINDKSLQSISAVKNNRVFMLEDKHISAVSQYVIYGVEDIAKAVYKDLF